MWTRHPVWEGKGAEVSWAHCQNRCERWRLGLTRVSKQSHHMHLLYACRGGWFKVARPHLAILSINENSLLAAWRYIGELWEFWRSSSIWKQNTDQNFDSANFSKKGIVIDILWEDVPFAIISDNCEAKIYEWKVYCMIYARRHLFFKLYWC